MSNNKFNHTIPQWLVHVAYANIFIIWGSTFLAILYGLKGFPPFMLSGFRFFVAGVLLLLWQLARGEKFPPLASWGKNAVTGILVLGAGTGLIAWSEQYVSSSEAAIVSATAPFWFIALDSKNWRTYFSDKLTLAGLFIGFAGLLLFFGDSLAGLSGNSQGSLRLAAFGVLALSAVAWVVGSLFSKSNPTQDSTVMNTAQQLLAGGAVSFAAGGFLGEWQGFSFERVPAEAWAGLTFLIVMGSIVAYLSYVWLLQISSPVLVSTHTYVNPVVAVFIGWLFMSETITAWQLVGLVVILAGVMLTNLAEYRILLRLRIMGRKMSRSSFPPHWLYDAYEYVVSGITRLTRWQ